MLDDIEDPLTRIERIEQTIRHNLETTAHILDQQIKISNYIKFQSKKIESLELINKEYERRLQLLEGIIL
jgi:hypothetical protein